MIYIGGYSKKNGIYICAFKNGILKKVGESEMIENPSYLHIKKSNLYAVSEKEKTAGEAASFLIEKTKLKLLNKKSTFKNSPCYLTSKDNNLFIANYGQGSIYGYDLKINGEIGDVIFKKEYENSNMHFLKWIKNQLYAVDLRNGCIYIYDNQLKEQDILKLENMHPRHFVSVKNNLYVLMEQENIITVYQNNQKIQEINTINDLNEISYAGAIKITKNNQYIYVTNRGENTISVFKVKNDFKLEFIQNIESFGDYPRDLEFLEQETYVAVANQNSDNISIFKRNIENGALQFLNNQFEIEKPACILNGENDV